MEAGSKCKAREFRLHSTSNKEISAASQAGAQCDKYASGKKYHYRGVQCEGRKDDPGSFISDSGGDGTRPGMVSVVTKRITIKVKTWMGY